MNKKFHIAAVSFLTGIAFVYAHDTGVPHEEPAVAVSLQNEVQLVPFAADGRRPVIGAVQADKRPLDRGMASTSASAPAVYMGVGVMVTGDPVIDEQIKVLNKEMELKIKALREEYALKIKAIIGNKKVLPRMATTTRMYEGGRPVMMGTTTANGDGHVLGTSVQVESSISKDQPRGDVSFIRSFFKGIFGR